MLIQYKKPPTNIPKTFMDILSFKKLLTTLGENSDEYMVRTTIIVEKVKVVIVRRAPARVLNISFANSTLVRNMEGIKFSTLISLVSINIATIARPKAIKIYLSKYNHILLLS